MDECKKKIIIVTMDRPKKIANCYFSEDWVLNQTSKAYVEDVLKSDRASQFVYHDRNIIILKNKIMIFKYKGNNDV